MPKNSDRAASTGEAANSATLSTLRTIARRVKPWSLLSTLAVRISEWRSVVAAKAARPPQRRFAGRLFVVTAFTRRSNGALA